MPDLVWLGGSDSHSWFRWMSTCEGNHDTRIVPSDSSRCYPSKKKAPRRDRRS
jgi:hypothetical protein